VAVLNTTGKRIENHINAKDVENVLL